MPNIGAGQILVILLVALVVLGPDKLPSAARSAGRVLREVRRVSSGFQQEMRDAMSAVEIDVPEVGVTDKQPDKGLHPGLGPGPSLPPAVAPRDQDSSDNSPGVSSDGPPASFS